MRLLDLGCGSGVPTDLLPAEPSDTIIGVDINSEALATAKARFPERTFISGRGESLPFPNETFDRVICNIALPYMHIPTALKEIRRVLKTNGEALIAIHTPSFTIQELKAAHRPKAIAFRLYVLISGICFHFTGRHLPNESFQTERGMRIALRRAGFGPHRLFPFRRRIVISAHRTGN